ncbi:hypothetical protein OESDEN_15667 [Oesophagostomum dentatum]|uniref:Uncharacterized protein n=1 Tax=Oesophagostomum dentatum TaxID=61180 RepID=A0A0B1SM93_OESDE|nr:hypothetical protein OESDEN_15667 [Oesophagostomum dentatum]
MVNGSSSKVKDCPIHACYSSTMSNRGNREPLAAQCTDQRSLNLFTMLETQNYPTHFVPINSTFGNPLIAVFPRIATEEVEKPTTK